MRDGTAAVQRRGRRLGWSVGGNESAILDRIGLASAPRSSAIKEETRRENV
jgi:hypothetical protein